MLGLFFWSLLWTYSCAWIASPLTHVHPEIEVAKRWSDQARWQKRYLTENQGYLELAENVTKVLRSTHNFLISDGKNHSETDNSSVECINSLTHFGYDFAKKKQYALYADDSDGKPGSGLFLGNIQWNGRYHECKRAHGQYFEGKWCSIDLGSRVPIMEGGNSLGVSLGICMPNTCSEDYLTDKLKPMSDKLGTPIKAKCPVQPEEWTTVDVASFTVFLVFASLVVLATAVELITLKQQNDDDSTALSGFTEHGIYFQKPREFPLPIKVLMSFSIIKNTKVLLDTEQRSDTIDALHGIRFFSIAWVVLGHAYIIPLLFTDNFIELGDWGNGQLSFQVVQNASYSVDTFFFISGLLATYIALRNAQRAGRLVVWKMYVMRYLRLTPPYAAIIFFLVGFYGKLGDGPMWPDAVAGESSTCRTEWWTNLLYINNLYPATMLSQCFAIGWYLANDMQFFLLAPISLLLLRWRPKAGVNLMVFGIFSSILVTGTLSSHFKEVPQSVQFAQILRAFSDNTNSSFLGDDHGVPPVTQVVSFWRDLYAKPWCRISVYLVGMLVGYLLHAAKGRIKMSKIFVASGWLAAATLSLVIIFGLWPYISSDLQMPVSLAAFYNAAARVSWAIALAWVVVACATGHGGPVNAFLSWKLFVPLSRLTYCIYLVHTLVLLWLYATGDDFVKFSNKAFVFNYLGALAISIVAAYLLSMLFEAPFVSLSKVCFPKSRKPADGLINGDFMVEEENDDGEGYSGLASSSSDDAVRMNRKVEEVILADD